MVKVDEATPAPNSRNCDIRTEWFKVGRTNKDNGV